MTYKVNEIVTVARDFKKKRHAELWAAKYLTEDEDRHYEVVKEK